MGKNSLSNIIALEYKSPSIFTVMPTKKAIKEYGQEPHNLSIDTQNQTWSYGTTKPRSVWVPGRFTIKIGKGRLIYNEGVAGIYDKTKLRHLENMIWTIREICLKEGRNTIED